MRYLTSNVRVHQCVCSVSCAEISKVYPRDKGPVILIIDNIHIFLNAPLQSHLVKTLMALPPPFVAVTTSSNHLEDYFRQVSLSPAGADDDFGLDEDAAASVTSDGRVVRQCDDSYM